MTGVSGPAHIDRCDVAGRAGAIMVRHPPFLFFFFFFPAAAGARWPGIVRKRENTVTARKAERLPTSHDAYVTVFSDRRRRNGG
jgi:hypothetical protein